MADWVSTRLGIRFALSQESWEFYRPDGEGFLSYVEISQRFEEERQRADQAEQTRRDAVPRLLGMGLSVEQVAEALGLSVEEVQAIAQG
jgi:DNA-binding NarL/FixJ family response regulator